METTEEASEPPPERLAAEEVLARLQELPGWELQGRTTLWRRGSYSTVLEAVMAAAIVAFPAVTRQHPVGIRLNNNFLYLSLTTPAAGGLTAEDFDLAWIVNLVL